MSANLREVFDGQNPILLRDGKYGLIVRLGVDDFGVRVPGEDDLRWFALDRATHVGGGSFIQKG